MHICLLNVLIYIVYMMFIIFIDNVSAVLTLNCNGDLNFPTSTVIPSTTLSTRTTTTTLPSKTLTTPAQTTTQTTTRTTTKRTTPTRTTQTTTKITIPRQTTATTTTFLSAVTTITAILSPLSTTTAQLPTTKQYSTAMHAESSTSLMCKHAIFIYIRNQVHCDIHVLQYITINDNAHLGSPLNIQPKKMQFL